MDRVGKPDQLLEVGRNQQDPHSGCSGILQFLPHRSLGSDVDAPGRLCRNQHHRVGHDLASHHQLLLISPGEGGGRHIHARGLAPRTCGRSPRSACASPSCRSRSRWRKAPGIGGQERRSPRAVTTRSSPCRCRSSGISPMPAPRRSRAGRWVTVSPASVDLTGGRSRRGR